MSSSCTAVIMQLRSCANDQLVHVPSRPSCDDMCCLTIVSQRRDRLPASGHACLQGRVCQQLHREEWKRRMSILETRAPIVKADRDSQPNSKAVAQAMQPAAMCGSSSQESAETLSEASTKKHRRAHAHPMFARKVCALAKIVTLRLTGGCGGW